jgi:hypothetical protein
MEVVIVGSTEIPTVRFLLFSINKNDKFDRRKNCQYFAA